MPIEGIGNLPMSFWSGEDWVQVVMPNVAHVPLLGYNLMSLKSMADRGHKYVGEKKGVTLHLKKGEDSVWFLSRNAELVFRIPMPS